VGKQASKQQTRYLYPTGQGCWVKSRADLGALKETEFSCPCFSSNPFIAHFVFVAQLSLK